jgi:hypothetical protein
MITLHELIQEGETFTDRIKFVPSHPNVIRMFSVYCIDNSSDYENWKATSLRFIRMNFHNDKSISEFETLSSDKISPANHSKMLALLKALSIVPQNNDIPPKQNRKENGVTINVNQSQNQTQNQEQNIAISVFVESIKDEITGKQLKEIKKIIETYKNRPEEAKPKIIEKLKSFGENTLSNILANIATNPLVFNLF